MDSVYFHVYIPLVFHSFTIKSLMQFLTLQKLTHSLDRRLENTLKYTTTVHFSYLGSNANPAFRCK